MNALLSRARIDVVSNAKKDSRRSIVVVHDSILGQGFDGGGGVIRIRDA